MAMFVSTFQTYSSSQMFDSESSETMKTEAGESLEGKEEKQK
jgi:hypothetical protein